MQRDWEKHHSLWPGELAEEKEEAKDYQTQSEGEGSIPSMQEALPILGHDWYGVILKDGHILTGAKRPWAGPKEKV